MSNKPKERRGSSWTSLVEYALHCVEAESAKTLVPLETGPDDYPWFSHDGPELLVSGRADHTAASATVAAYLDQRGRRSNGSSGPLIYGWPAIVAMSAVSGGPPRRHITPLYVVKVEHTKVRGGWTLTAAHEPEFNLAALANRPENADTADEIRKLAFPFGDPQGVAQAATEAAGLLGYDPPDLDPDRPAKLERTAGRGVHNAAVFFAADFSEYRSLVHKELSELVRKDDWASTAAAWLVGKAKGKARRPSTPLAAALQANHSQEAILAAIRTKPLTVVTGPPGTGKTQLVVNAVANAWLDNETVLVASTNNAAVDVAVERADRDVMQGLLIRTGHRGIKQQVAQAISSARTKARKFVGPPTETATKALAKAGNYRSGRIAMMREQESLDQRLLSLVQERRKAHGELALATAALRSAGDAAGDEVEAALEEGRVKARAAGAELLEARERWKIAMSAPMKGGPFGWRARSGLCAADVERIGNAAEALQGSGLFRLFERRRLRQEVGCPPDTAMEHIRAWAAIWQKDEAERLLAAASRRLTQTLGGDDSSNLEAALGWIETERRLTEVEREFESVRTRHEKLAHSAGAGRNAPLLGESTRDRKWTDSESDREWSRRSLIAVRAKVAERLVTARTGALPAFSSVSMHSVPFGQAVEKALGVFQGWACTALSAGGSFPLKAGLFDLVIVDEASQCCLADILPLAYRAKRIVIAGDPNQLRATTVVGDAHLRQIARKGGRDEDDLRDRGLHHKDGSAYQAFEYAADSQPYLLDEHYRCHPHIAKWFNETFYGGDLNVLSDVTQSAGKRAVVWRDVAGDSRRPRGRGGWVNEAQARTTVDLLERLVKPESTIGVVAPYAAQGALIEHMVRRKIDEGLLAEIRFVCGTAHRLQGAERDVVVFSSTFTPNMPPRAANWIEQERNLMNVAVSRARRMLVVVGHPDLAPEHSRTLASLREYILAVEKPGESHVASAHTHSDAERLLLGAMRRKGLMPLGKPDVEGFELDFALIDGAAKLNVEVDGDHHLDGRGRQQRNDLARDQILGGLGWEVLRIPAWRCHDAPEQMADEIRSAFERLCVRSADRSGAGPVQ